MISGLISTIFSSGFFLKLQSITVSRCEMLICGAASPIPCAAYIDSNISSTSFFSFASKTVTGSPGFCQHRVRPLHHLMNLAYRSACLIRSLSTLESARNSH